MKLDVNHQELRRRYEATEDFDHGLQYVRALQQAEVVQSGQPEVLANDLFFGWDMARVGAPESGPVDGGALLGLDLEVVHQQIWQHIRLNALFLHHDGLTYLCLPQRAHERLTSLPALPWPNATVLGTTVYGTLLNEVVRETVWRGLTARGAPVEWSESALRPLDFAPLVEERLREMITPASSRETLSSALGLLELLLRFRGGGSAEMLRATICFQARAMAEEIEASVGREAARDEALAALERCDDGLLGHHEAGEGTRVGALALRRHGIDGASDGWVTTLSELVLILEPTRGWRLDRRVLWEDREEGTPMS